MGLHFEETMSGTVDTGQADRHFKFSVNADSPTVLALGGWAPLRLTGTATLESAVEGAPVLPGSTLEIGLPFHRHLKYTVFFKDRDGHTYRFFGQKTVFLRDLAKTMTTLTGNLFRDGKEVGHAVLRFRLTDLGRFLASFRPWENRPS